MVNLDDIPDFPGLPGQRPPVGETPTVSPVSVVVVYAPLDSAGTATPINAAAVDAYISAEITAGRAYSTEVERWSPWSDLQLQLGFKAGSAFNYGRFTLGDGSKWYAYLEAEYLNLTDTRYRVTPDDWTTYAPTLGYCMVRRGHVAVAASQNDTYGDQYLLEPEPIEAPPTWGAIQGDAFTDSLGTWTAVVTSANDLRGLGDVPFFEPHRNSGYIGAAAYQATEATAGITGGPQFEIDAPEYPWSDLVATVGYFWPFNPSTFNSNNGHPEDGFRTAERPTHNGIDMGYGVANIEGSPIRAIRSGVVTFAGSDGGYGFRVVVDHGDGYRSTYSHMFESPDVSNGQPVVTGQILGGIGTTGTSTGNHLHFEIYDVGAGDYIDPMGFMAVQNPSNLVVGDEPIVEAEIYIPKVTPAIPSVVDGVAAGGGVFTFSMAGLVNYLAIMQNAPWVIDGISSIRLVPSWAVPNPGGSLSAVGEPPRSPSSPDWATAAAIPVYHSSLPVLKPTETAIANWRAAALSAAGASNWRKLLTSQFCEVVIGGRDQVALAPELIQSSNIQLRGIAGSVTGGADVVVPVDYSRQDELTAVGIDASGLATMATAGYGIAMRDPATLDLAFAQLGWGNAYNRVVMIQQYALALAVAADSAAINLGSQGIQTLLGSVAGGPAGLALGAGSVATSAITSALNMGVLDMKLEESVEIAAYQLGVSGIMGSKSVDAVVQAANSQSGRGGSESVGGWRNSIAAGVSAVVKMPAPDRLRAAVSMFERYGYTVGRAMVPPRIDPMERYSYWQVDDATILGAMPDDARRRLADRFARGTTVWQNVAEIGTRPANPPRAGVVY